jgi:hypothetical protein
MIKKNKYICNSAKYDKAFNPTQTNTYIKLAQGPLTCLEKSPNRIRLKVETEFRPS